MRQRSSCGSIGSRLRRVGAWLALATTVLAGGGCADDDADPDLETTDEALTATSVGLLVEQRLATRHPRERGKTWHVTSGSLPNDWLMQVPVASTWGQTSIPAPPTCSGPVCAPDLGLALCQSDAQCGASRCVALAATKTSDAMRPTKVCAGHSDAVLDQIYEVITSAQSFVDIATLSAPRGRFLGAIRNALTTLDKRGRPMVVRVLLGSYPGNRPDITRILADLTRDLRPGSPLQVNVGAHRNTLISWNHSKIIAADGREAIVGGMNLWGDHYLGAEPVRDVSLRLTGPVAAAAQTFLDEAWDAPCSDPAGAVIGRRGFIRCPNRFGSVQRPVAAGNVRMIGVGRLGKLLRNSADTALVAMMDAARSNIRITQQDVGSMRLLGFDGHLSSDVVDAWVRAAMRGVDVEVIVSNLDSYGGTGRDDADEYANGWNLDLVWRIVMSKAKEAAPNDRRVEPTLCRKLRFAYARSSDARAWPSGSPIANHSKVVIVDDLAHYVGSQNLYGANLAEYGVIVDDARATRQFVADYYTPFATYSRRTTFVARSCERHL